MVSASGGRVFERFLAGGDTRAAGLTVAAAGAPRPDLHIRRVRQLTAGVFVKIKA